MVKEHLWSIIKKESNSNNLNPYDTYFFILTEKNKKEALLGRELSKKEVTQHINQGIRFLKLQSKQ